MTLDLDDTTHCPGAEACAGCGTPENLHLNTYDTQLGVYCQTVCARCTTAGSPSPMGLYDVIDLVLAHCGHLGCDLDEAAAVRAAEREDTAGGAW
ncbi:MULTISPECIES: hypothetical protein [unclassified Crossiella]|uniref:hypothetical protein n=1 Tax=unclassified Crossiella TaxID=2620835 RepID=UPI001FFFA49B|nr:MULTISPECIES: hypothetical protein [unclassified Crossiella]MCK2242175.1 hypothetical protein [Crossiella sp. S99.2]MCK2256078.1 hypothetical protein [Crossiella sp. S99.1]